MTDSLPEEWSRLRGSGKFSVRGDVSRGNFRGADLSGVRLERWTATSADFRDADFEDFRAMDCDFTASRFVGAALREARFFDCVLSGADFSACLMEGLMLSDCKLFDSNLEEARLRGCDMAGSLFTRARLLGADLRDVKAKQVSFDDADLRGADLRFGDFNLASFRGAQLGGVRWDGARLEGAEFDAGTGANILAEALRAHPDHASTKYAALECREGSKTWYVIERASDKCEVVRVDQLEPTSAGLEVKFTQLTTLPPLVACGLIEELVLRGLLAGAHGGARPIFHDSETGLRFVLPP